jgi:cystathionine beta-lyase
MRYDFDKQVDRTEELVDSLKWDSKPGELPMWVADMDFETVPEVQETIQKRASHGTFGYAIEPDGWSEAYVKWWKEHHHFQMQKENLIFATGAVPAISSMVRSLTNVAENVLIMTPVYNIFFNSILNNGRKVLESPMVYDGKAYHVDFEDLEKKMADPQTTLMILCNPHNPIGHIWPEEDLVRIAKLAYENHVVVISDEVHCDLVDPDKEYTPFASVSTEARENSITCLAPSKTFNLAGIQSAAVYVENPLLRQRVWRGLNTDEVAEGNAFAYEVAMAAFTYGWDWLTELRAYIYENKQFVTAFLRENLPELHLIPEDATYLLWVDISKVSDDGRKLAAFIRKETGLWVTGGDVYGGDGAKFLRINIATTRKNVADGMRRLKTGIAKYERPDIVG